MNLYINSCVRKESRTNELAQALMKKLGGEFEEVKTFDGSFKPLSEESLTKRSGLIENGQFEDPMFAPARQFADADTIVIGAPFWDASFPSSLKVYFENIYVTGIVSRYSDEGVPVGLCKAKKLYYVTTAGGEFIPAFSYEYVKALAQMCFGIPEVYLVKAEMLDIVGNDPRVILEAAKAAL